MDSFNNQNDVYNTDALDQQLSGTGNTSADRAPSSAERDTDDGSAQSADLADMSTSTAAAATTTTTTTTTTTADAPTNTDSNNTAFGGMPFGHPATMMAHFAQAMGGSADHPAFVERVKTGAEQMKRQYQQMCEQGSGSSGAGHSGRRCGDGSSAGFRPPVFGSKRPLFAGGDDSDNSNSSNGVNEVNGVNGVNGVNEANVDESV
ncbi:hypothetical protein RI367_000098 [Sorochytrium milnesiophthora]